MATTRAENPTDVEVALAAVTPAEQETIAEEDAPISVPDSGDSGEGGKLKMIVQLVKKCLGVKDIAAMRLSLPASLLEPIPNLEYWHYIDRPDLFAAITDSDDPFERMLAVLRFTFTKDLKFIHGKVCKPYNSVLGEHFRAHWDVVSVSPAASPLDPPILHHYITAPAGGSTPLVSRVLPISVSRSLPGSASAPILSSDATSTKSARSSKSTRSSALSSNTAATSPQTVESNLEAGVSNLSLDEAEGEESVESSDSDVDGEERLRVVFLTEQVSHHPPISAYHATCPARGITLSGYDQISAKVSGTTLRVSPGAANKGIHVTVEERPQSTTPANGAETSGSLEPELFSITHPVANVNGILRGSFYVTVGESTMITSSGGSSERWTQKGWEENVRLRTIIEYKDESWLGKPRFLVEGVIHTYTVGEIEHEEWKKVRDVPTSKVIAVFDGSWKGKIRWKKVGEWPIPKGSSALTSGNTTPSRSSLSVRSSKEMKQKEIEPYRTLLDLSTLHSVPKSVRPIERQLPNESRRLWDNVTVRLMKKEFGDATKEKVAIEQRQRDEAGERKKKGVEFTPRYFEQDLSSGISVLTPAGRAAIEEELAEESAYRIARGTSVAEKVTS